MTAIVAERHSSVGINMKSDEEYIEAIRVAHHNRKKRAIYCVALIVIIVVVGYFWNSKLQESMTKLQETQSRMFKEGIKITEMDLRLIEVTNELAYAIGMRVGMAFNTLAVMVGMLIGYAIYYIIGSRKDRLLIKCYDELRSLE